MHTSQIVPDVPTQYTQHMCALEFIFEMKTAFQKDILISRLPIHYSLRIYKWKWIESLDISLESLRLVCGLNIVNYPKHILDFRVCLLVFVHIRYIFQGFTI